MIRINYSTQRIYIVFFFILFYNKNVKKNFTFKGGHYEHESSTHLRCEGFTFRGI